MTINIADTFDSEATTKSQNTLFGVGQYLIWARKDIWESDYSFYIITKNWESCEWYCRVPRQILQEFITTAYLRHIAPYMDTPQNKSIDVVIDDIMNDVPTVGSTEQNSFPEWFMEEMMIRWLQE